MALVSFDAVDIVLFPPLLGSFLVAILVNLCGYKINLQ
uniref:Uncharacterized protein n=1 Tax=Arundo donax TaxID=35708 RepID=A0A0A9U7K0_ARUDO